jgi:hypothetical protein
MGRSARPLGRVSHGTQLDLGSKFSGPSHSRVEVFNFEPQQYSMAPRPDVGLAQRTVVVLDFPAMQLKDEPPVAVDEPFIVGSTVVALRPEEMLKPFARGLDVVDGKEWLWAHDSTVATARQRMHANHDGRPSTT